MDKNIKLGIIFSVVFVILMIYYYRAKPDFIVEDKTKSDKKVSNSKAVSYALGVSLLVVILIYLVESSLVKNPPKSLRMSWRMGGSCSCQE